MQLFVGLNSHRGSINRYGFDLLEMPVSPSLPKLKTLRELREHRPHLRFTLRLHPDVALVGESHPDVARVTAAADALGAAVVVVPTGPRFTPSTRNKKALAQLCDALRGEDRLIAWEPRGVWTPVESTTIASDLGALLVGDLTRQPAPASGTIYTRLLPFGSGARVSQNAIETLAQNLEGADTAYVVVQGEGAKMTRSQLQDHFEAEDD